MNKLRLKTIGVFMVPEIIRGGAAFIQRHIYLITWPMLPRASQVALVVKNLSPKQETKRVWFKR